MADSYHWIYAKDLREIPEWIVEGHSWHNAVPLEKLEKLQMKVRMCCSKCEEKVEEEIREVKGVFDVRAEKAKRKVVVVVTPNRGDVERKVLRKARKVDKKAQFVELDAQEKAQKKPDKGEKKEDKKDDSGFRPLPGYGNRSHDGSGFRPLPGYGNTYRGGSGFRPLPGHGNEPRIPGRDVGPAPPGYYPKTGNKSVVRQPPQSLSTDSDSPERIKPNPKEESIFKKAVTFLCW